MGNGVANRYQTPCIIGLAKSCVSRTHNRLRTISDLQLAQDVGDVVSHCFGAQHQPGCDLCICRSLRDQVQDFSLATA
jgi:hypothetical protein